MQELEYNPSRKDLTDARIHHLLAEELVKPYRRHRRLSYSRHAVNDRDLSTQVNYRMHFNIRRLVADKKHHHSKRHSKKLNKDGKQNHVSFPEFQQNGTAKQFSHVTYESINTDSAKRSSRGSIDGGDLMRVTTPTATETMLPWKRDEEENSAPLQQCEFPAWASNKEYLAYNSPSATFLGGIENHRSSVIGLFRRESIGSDHFSSNDSTPRRERRGSSGAHITATMFIDESEPDPLGAMQKPPAINSNTIPPLPQPPQTPGQRRQNRRGSMLELSGSITRDTIPEETSDRNGAIRRPSWLAPSNKPKPITTRQITLGSTLMGNVSSPSPPLSDSDNSGDDDDIEFLMKAGF
ncbi:hypothetical protein HHI36_020385 [Cryptolaemus montrouzieri]|uniref:Uncharacterized protein n=1 Tax=Cryptolaemus montrouzieri TaxID=559131 RepID=A0ABD2NAH3_9CUCU